MNTRICKQCGTEKPVVSFPLRGGIRALVCRDCATDYKRKRTAKKVAIAAAKVVEKPSVTTNPFLWRTFVQPFQPKDQKWLQHSRNTEPESTLFKQYP